MPATIRVRGRRWLVLRETDLSDSPRDRAAREELKSCRGITHTDRREIHLGRHASARALASTFLHELMHACSRDRTCSCNEEAFISDIEGALLDALEQLHWARPRARPMRHMPPRRVR
jgi:hypothetical protein